ncbi:Sodium/calcium exchanger NCL, partial [Mucuna pruriens]
MALHVECHSLHPSVFDGVDAIQPRYAYLQFKDQKVEVESSFEGDYCKQMYVLLPCSNNILGHLFLILVYEYLLFHGESYLDARGEQISKILSPGVFSVSTFDILDALPKSLILVVTRLSSDKESAQEYASTGVGLLAGLSILLLSVVWGTTHHNANSQFVPLLFYNTQCDLDDLQTSIRGNKTENFQRVEKQTLQTILTDNQTPNVVAISGLPKESLNKSASSIFPALQYPSINSSRDS